MTEEEMIAELRKKGYCVVKPEFIKIGNENIQKPLMEYPPIGTYYYVADIKNGDMAECFTWQGCGFDMRCLQHGLVHLTREAALAHGEALIKVSGGTCE